MTPDLRTLADRFGSAFRSRVGRLGKVGREAEFPVVDREGRAVDVRPILEELAGLPGSRVHREGALVVGVDRPRWSFVLEVGWGTIEVVTGPVDDLHQLGRLHEDALAELVPVLARHGAFLLGLGSQPRTPPGPELMSPKARYRVLRQAIGPGWDSFTVTASDQLHVDVARSELVALTDLLNLLAPAVVALCANSPLVGGAPAGVRCAREALMGSIDAALGRHGMPPGPARDLDGWLRHLAGLPLLVRRDPDWRADGRPFREVLERGEADYDTFLLHEHYAWNSARPRTAHSTLELRAACQQPHDEHLAAAALGLGLVEGAAEAGAALEDLDAPWDTLRAWHPLAVRHGLEAAEPSPRFLERILEAAAAGLARRERGEEIYLEPLARRLRQREEPAAAALRLAAAGWPELVTARAAR